MCEKNVIYRNLKNAILKGKSSKNGKTKDPENSTKSERPYGRMAYDETNCPKSSIFKVFSKNIILKKIRKIRDFQGLLSQKVKNSMSRFSTNTPVRMGPQNSRTTCPHGPVYSNDSRVLDLRFFFVCQ